MPRGEEKKGKGKSQWKHGKTKVIRVPEALADQIIEYARDLDEGKIKNDDAKQIASSLKVIDLSGISTKLIEGEMGVRLSDLAKKGYQLLPSRINDIVSASLKNRKR